MKKKLFLTIAAIYFSLNINAQSWVALDTGTDNWVNSLTVDSVNNILYAGGYFLQAGGNSATRIAQWNGTNWSSIGLGADDGVHALQIINGELYVGGEFLNAGGISATRIAKYDGSTWTTFGNGLAGTVKAIAEYNGEIYTGGNDGLKKWDGSAWIDPGSGVGGFNPYVQDLKIYNGELYVAGTFGTAGGLTADGIAKWNGSAWSIPGGTGLNSFGAAFAMEIFNGELYVGGIFTSAGGTPDTCLAKWNGTSWIGINSGISGGLSGTTEIYSLKAIDNYLYIGGNFDSFGGMITNFVAKYDGTSFSNVGVGTSERVHCLDSYNGNLIAGGRFPQAGGTTVNNIAEWTIPSGIQHIESENKMIIHPNPSTGKFIIAFDKVIANGNIEIINVLGKSVLVENIFFESKKEIKVDNVSEGIYFVKVIDGEKEYFQKIIIE